MSYVYHTRVSYPHDGHRADSSQCYYGGAHVLNGVSLQVLMGYLIALLGRNGAGKTSFIRSLMGMSPPVVRRGSMCYSDHELVGTTPHQIARLGLALAVADEVYILGRGAVIYHETPAELQASPETMHRYPGV